MDTQSLAMDWMRASPELSAWGLILVRVAGVSLTAPVTAAPGLDWRHRFVIAVGLGVLLAPMLAPRLGPIPTGMACLWAMVSEAATGSLLGWSAALIVAGARQAGDLVSAQAGLSAASLFDPETGEELTALGHLYGLIALAVFLSLNGPLVMVEALIQSYQSIPAGSLSLDQETVNQAFTIVGRALVLALQAAAPVAIALAAAGIAMSWIGRLAPAVPILSLSLPIRSMLGIFLIIIGMVALTNTLSQAWTTWPVSL